MDEIYKVSIVIPVYNVQDYLNECVESVIRQTYKNLEIILVDDGSLDICPMLCDQWKIRDNRIIVIHKENGGLSDARNTGLLRASGDYILYVDSDDYIEKDTVEWMVSCAKMYHADIVACTHKKTEGDNIEKLLTQKIVKGTGVEMLQFAFDNEIWFAWGKLIKSSIAKKCPFVKGLIYEDVENTPRVFLKASTIVFSLDGRYNYRIRPDSIMGKNKTLPSSDIVKVINADCEYIMRADISTFDKNIMYKLLFKHIVYNYNIAITSNSFQALDLCSEIEILLRKHNSRWSKCNCISLQRKVAYGFLCKYPVIYKLSYRVYKAICKVQK